MPLDISVLSPLAEFLWRSSRNPSLAFLACHYPMMPGSQRTLTCFSSTVGTGTDLSYSGLDPPPSDKSESALSSNQLALNVDSSSVSALRPARISLIKDATSLPREREKQGKKHLAPPNSETAAQESLNRRLLKGNSNSNSPFPKSQITLRPKHLYLMKTRDLFKPHHSRRTTIQYAPSSTNTPIAVLKMVHWRHGKPFAVWLTPTS